jgi:hypothetical protein
MEQPRGGGTQDVFAPISQAESPNWRAFAEFKRAEAARLARARQQFLTDQKIGLERAQKAELLWTEQDRILDSIDARSLHPKIRTRIREQVLGEFRADLISVLGPGIYRESEKFLLYQQGISRQNSMLGLPLISGAR